MWASAQEAAERFLAETCEAKPADKDDIRFEHGVFADGMEETPFWLHLIDDTGTIVERHVFATEAEVWSLIESFRYAQARREEAARLGVHPLEIEFAPFGPAWLAEQEDRRRGF
jgi:hypothetical protein